MMMMTKKGVRIVIVVVEDNDKDDDDNDNDHLWISFTEVVAYRPRIIVNLWRPIESNGVTSFSYTSSHTDDTATTLQQPAELSRKSNSKSKSNGEEEQ